MSQVQLARAVAEEAAIRAQAIADFGRLQPKTHANLEPTAGRQRLSQVDCQPVQVDLIGRCLAVD